LVASGRKASTKTVHATVARQHIIGSKIGTQQLDKLGPSHIEAWKVELEHRGLSESTIRSAYTILRAVLDTAVRDKALAQNPATRRPSSEGDCEGGGLSGP
jgi:site-specific recombinase XerC